MQNLPTEQLNKVDEVSHNHLIKATNNLPMEQLQNIPLSGVFGLNPTVVDSHGQILAGQGHHFSGQSHMQHVLLHPPPQYGVQQSNLERQWNQSQLNFPINVNQTNYLLTGDHQVLPVIPVFKQGPEGQVVPGSMPVTEVQGQNGNQARSVQISFSHNDTVQTMRSTDSHTNNFVSSQIAGPNTNNSVVKDLNSLLNPVQSQPVRQYQIVSDQGVQLVNVQSSDVEQNIGEQTITSDQVQRSDKPEGGVSSSQVSLDQSENINPNIYFQFVQESPEKVKQVPIDKNTKLNTLIHKPTVSIQNDYEFIARPLPVVANDCERNIQKESSGHSVEELTEDSSPRTNLRKTNEDQALMEDSLSENSSEMILDDAADQAGQVPQQTNQTQLIVPVSLFQSFNTNGTGAQQIPSQIQISFQTCTSESNQPSLTQQIILPHGNVVTLPLMPVSSNKDISMSTDISTSSMEKVTQDNVVSIDVVPDNIKNISRENIQSEEGIGQRPKYLAIDKGNKTEQIPSKSRNCSGNSRKSRSSSGSSDKSKRSAVHFSDTDKLESLQEHGHASLRPESLTDFHFVSKLNRSRHRQFSGNSEHGDRSRKSSGNSVFSETSSHASGLTLSNLASPNIFLDKEKGIFFIHSIDGLDEIDNNQLVDLIHAVEADPANVAGIEKQGRASESDRNDQELEALVQSDKLESENFETFSRIAPVGKPKTIKNICVEDTQTVAHSKGFELPCYDGKSQTIGLLSHDIQYTGAKLNEDFSSKAKLTISEETDTDIVGEHLESNPKHHYKKKGKQASKKGPESKHKNKTSELSISNTISLKEGQHSDNRGPSKSFVPIAPKVSHKGSNVETTRQEEPNSRLSHNAPVLSSLLSRKPIFNLSK